MIIMTQLNKYTVFVTFNGFNLSNCKPKYLTLYGQTNYYYIDKVKLLTNNLAQITYTATQRRKITDPILKLTDIYHNIILLIENKVNPNIIIWNPI